MDSSREPICGKEAIWESLKNLEWASVGGKGGYEDENLGERRKTNEEWRRKVEMVGGGWERVR